MMNQAERRAFVAEHRTCIFGFQRKHGPPSMSVVYYVMDGDEILISTMAERAKARAVRRTREAAICVLDEKWPLTYLQVYGPADVEDVIGTTVDVMMKVGQIMSGPTTSRVRAAVGRGKGTRGAPCGDPPRAAVDSVFPSGPPQRGRRRLQDAAWSRAAHALEGVSRLPPTLMPN